MVFVSFLQSFLPDTGELVYCTALKFSIVEENGICVSHDCLLFTQSCRPTLSFKSPAFIHSPSPKQSNTKP
jgi:hypothetical protein